MRQGKIVRKEDNGEITLDYMGGEFPASFCGNGVSSLTTEIGDMVYFDLVDGNEGEMVVFGTITPYESASHKIEYNGAEIILTDEEITLKRGDTQVVLKDNEINAIVDGDTSFNVKGDLNISVSGEVKIEDATKVTIGDSTTAKAVARVGDAVVAGGSAGTITAGSTKLFVE